MDQLKTSFEENIKLKLSQKCTSTGNEQAQLLKCFKYFDSNDNGMLDPNEFKKAIEKIGILIPSQKDLQALFSLYDRDNNGTISYREFASDIFGFDVGGDTPNADAEALLEKLRSKLKSRGARGIIGLGRNFRICDDNHSMSLDHYEFAKAMTDFGLGFTDSEIKCLFNLFDTSKNNLIEYDEFLRCIAGPMNNTRMKLVKQAFKIMDKDGNGYLDYNDLVGVYSGKFHPDVISGKKTEKMILSEFLETFEMAHNDRNQSSNDQVVTGEEWVEYYNNVSASIDRDDYFTLMMTNAWNLDGKRTDKKGWAGENKAAGGFSASKGLDGKLKGEPRAAHKAQHATDVQDEMNLNYSEKQLCEVMRKKLAARGARGIQGLGRQFKIADDDNSKALSVDEFKNAIHDFRVGLNESDTARLFKIFDRDHSGSIDYEEFLRGVRGEMNEFRTSIAMLAFNIMDCDKSGVIDINDIRSKYNAKMHPDVKSGKKTEDEILFEFIDTFEKHHSDNVEDIKDGRVSKSEWKEYYNNVSMSIDTDEYFETMMNNAWKLKGNDKVKKGWGGQF